MSAPIPITRPRAGTPTDRARFIARGYREALEQVHPELCKVLDQHAEDLGETWVTRRVDNGEHVFTRVQAAEYAQVRPSTITQWVTRGFLNRYDGMYARDELDAILRTQPGKRRSIANSHQLDL